MQPRIAAFYQGNALVNNIMGHGLHSCVCGHLVGESLDVSIIERRFHDEHKPPLDPDAGPPPDDFMVTELDGVADGKNIEALEAKELADEEVEYLEGNQDDVYICEKCRREVCWVGLRYVRACRSLLGLGSMWGTFPGV